ncbi:MAG: cold shock domain-containing protein [Candidatus Latescibacterota bacterium]
MPNGIIRYFSESRGYGFIEYDDINRIFVHHSQIQTNGYRTLREGEEVSFEVKKGRRGLEAVNVQKL